MPQILRNLLGSEKFMYVLLLWCVPMLVFTLMGKLTIEQWREDSLWALGMLLAGKTVQGTAAALAKKPPGEPNAKTSKKES